MLNSNKPMNYLSPLEPSPHTPDESLILDITYFVDPKNGTKFFKCTMIIPVLILVIIAGIFCALTGVDFPKSAIAAPLSQDIAVDHVSYDEPSVTIYEAYDLPATRYVQAVGSVNVREYPHLESKILSSISLGSSAEFKNQVSSDARGVKWYLVETKNQHIIGWVSSKYAILM